MLVEISFGVINFLFVCRFMEPLTSKVPTMVIEGNHEIEPQASGITFKSYSERFAVPASESGSNSNFYYSFDAGGVHFVMLGAYVDYNNTGKSMDTLEVSCAPTTIYLISMMIMSLF